MDTRKSPAFRFAAAAFILALVATGCSKEAKKSRALSSGDKYFKAGEYEKAKIDYLNVIKVDPGNAIAIRQLGLIWSEEGAPLRALPYLFKTKELEPGNMDVRLKLAYGFASSGQSAEARQELQAILEKDPANEEAIVLLMNTVRTDEEFDQVQQVVQAVKEGSAIPHLYAVNAALRKRDLNAVQAALEKALAADPKSVQAHMARANVYLIQRKLDEAEAEYKITAELSPVRTAARLRYAEFLVQRGKVAEGAAWVEETTKAAPDFIPAWATRANIALAENKFDESLSFLQKVFSLDGGNIEGHIIEGQALLGKNEVKKAVEVLENLDKTYPNVPMVKFHLARAYVRSNNVPQAQNFLEQAISTSPDFTDAILLLAELELRQGNPRAVEGPMFDLLKKQPELPLAQTFLAQAYSSTGRLAEAAAIYEPQIKSTPNDPQPQLLLALVLRQQGKLKEAREAFSKVEQLVPDSLLPLSQLVEIDLSQKDYTAALQKIDARLEKEPKAAGAHLLKGRVYVAQKDWDNAEAALKKAIELEANFITAYDMLARVYIAANKLTQAIDQMNEVLAKDPNNKRVLLLSGVCYIQLKDFRKAANAFEKLLAIAPDNAPALNNLAWLCSEQLNEPAKALELGRKARSLNTTDPAIADTYGWILYRQGQYQQALTLLREAAGQLSQNPEVSYHLGMAAYMMADKELARKSLQVALDSPQAFPGKEEINARLALLPDAGKISVSPDELKRLLEKQPQDTVAWLRLGELYEQQNAPADAAKAYENALQVNPKLLPAVLRLASLNAEYLNNKARALELARSARDLAPRDAAVAASAGHIALNGGNYPWAYSLLQEAARGNADNPAVLYDLAMASYSLGRLKEACETMQRSTTAPNAQIAQNAQRFLKMVTPDGKTPTVPAEEVDAALKANPADVPALMVRGAAEEQKGDSKAALATYNQVLKTYQAFAPAQKRLAALYVDTPENRDKAYTLAVEARKTLPEDTELTRTLAMISYQRGEYPYAVQLLDGSAKKSPLAPKELYYLGMARNKTKADPAATTEALKSALDGGLAEPMASEAKRVVAELEKNQ